MRWLAAILAPCALLANEELFESKVRPVLAKNCFACHGASKMGGLEISSRASLLKGGKSGAAINVDNPPASLLLRAIRHESGLAKMPPSGGPLTPAEIAAIEQWIREGAAWPERAAAPPSGKGITPEQRQFWAFQPVRAPATGASIDSLHGKSGALADRRTLLRRVTYDLTGLPPTAAETEAFLQDKSPGAYAALVDRLLASAHYGERWGRYWLDVARYADDKLAPERDEPRVNAFRYRDWVVKAFNDDLPYNTFVKAHVAGDSLGPEYVAALGMYAMSPEFQEDRVDVTTRGFLGLTVACAQCHDHKFDPIPTRDYYALLGVFENSEAHEYPLAEKAVVELYKQRKEALEAAEEKLKKFAEQQAELLALALAHRTAEYWRGADGLEPESAERWRKYAKRKKDDYQFFDGAKSPEAFQDLLLAVFREKQEVEEKNLITLGGSKKRGDLAGANLASLERDRYFLWRDFFAPGGVFHFNEASIGRFLGREMFAHLERLRGEVAAAKTALPPQYPFLHTLIDKEKIQKPKIYLRGNKQTPGDTIESAFLSVLAEGPPKPFAKGSGREGLAEALVEESNPLTARVMANRIWAWHFGEGIVPTASNFGQLGERPKNPALLDLLAWNFSHQHQWSIKALHREILLSQAYQAAEFARRRLDAEALRDSILAVSGLLDRTVGGPSLKLDEKNRRRTLYGHVSRRKLDPMLALFDFPNPVETSEKRVETNVPLQRLFLLNSPLVLEAAKAMADRAKSIDGVYEQLFARRPTAAERQAGEEFTATGNWPLYVQALFATDEFLYLR
jgi:hypothetical protein